MRLSHALDVLAIEPSPRLYGNWSVATNPLFYSSKIKSNKQQTTFFSETCLAPIV